MSTATVLGFGARTPTEVCNLRAAVSYLDSVSVCSISHLLFSLSYRCSVSCPRQ